MPRRQARPSRQVPRPAAGAFDDIKAGADVAERLERRRFEHVEPQTGEAVPAPPLYPGPPSILAGHLAADRLVSALVLLIITDGRGLDWGRAPPSRFYSRTCPRHRPRPRTFSKPSRFQNLTAGILPLDRGNLALRLPRPDRRPARRGRL